mmetsp:Transcript_49534/g.50335  ORF Transcript_49534/g.50335 Transcript_49534/m.50335 type:complete len:108 (+) Transcript_49534:148-471(+)
MMEYKQKREDENQYDNIIDLFFHTVPYHTHCYIWCSYGKKKNRRSDIYFSIHWLLLIICYTVLTICLIDDNHHHDKYEISNITTVNNRIAMKRREEIGKQGHDDNLI